MIDLATDMERDLAIRQFIGSSIVSDHVLDIFDAAGLDKPNIGILDDDFPNEVRKLAVALLERLLEDAIKNHLPMLLCC